MKPSDDLLLKLGLTSYSSYSTGVGFYVILMGDSSSEIESGQKPKSTILVLPVGSLDFANPLTKSYYLKCLAFLIIVSGCPLTNSVKIPVFIYTFVTCLDNAFFKLFEFI